MTMYAIEQIKRTREYLDYLEEHINNVSRAWRLLQDRCKDMRFIYDDFYYNWLGSEVEEHDMSKLSEQEFIQYRKEFYPCNREVNYPHDGEVSNAFFAAWEHHKKYNPHHWENWTAKHYYHPNEWEVHCVHMVIDWMAMGFKFEDTAQIYYEKFKDKIILPDYAVDFIYEIFKRIDNVTDGGDCWCNPEVIEESGGKVIVHNHK